MNHLLPGGLVARTLCSQMQGAQVQSLTGELDSMYHTQK